MKSTFTQSAAVFLLFLCTSLIMGCVNENEGDSMNNVAVEQHALGGYDAVSYFDNSEPQKGATSFSFDWSTKKWLFANKANLDKFSQNPSKYAPQFDGHCSFAMSLGKTENGDPLKWHIKDDKLYLNSNGIAGLLWKLVPGRIDAAEKNWSSKK